MKSLMISFLTLIICSVTIHSANADRCSDYRQRTGLDLNEAECYVLELGRSVLSLGSVVWVR
jgi:hypothetical protein